MVWFCVYEHAMVKEEGMSSENKPSINLAPNGPYIVKGLTNLSSRNGQIETEETIALCRCGKSSNKPYCDGTHAKISFSTENTEQHLANKCDEYAGQHITIHDNRSICAHAGVCTDNLASVFRMKQEPWIDPDAAGIDEIIAVIKKCPSGALSFTMENIDGPAPDPESAIFISPNGPYVVSGCPDLVNTNWREGASKQQYTLCRCGASKNKPYCDGSHWSIEFTDDDN